MAASTVEHGTFEIERRYGASPQQVFQAFARQEAKSAWMGSNVELDFRVGGTERLGGKSPDGNVYSYEARYMDIVEDQRIIYAYDMHLGDDRISTSLSTVEMLPDGEGTHLLYVEHGVFLDGLDGPSSREGGTESLLDKLGEVAATLELSE